MSDGPQLEEFMTYIEWRNRPVIFTKTIKNILRSNRGFRGTVDVWKLRKATNDYIFVGSIGLMTVPANDQLDDFIKRFLNKED